MSNNNKEYNEFQTLLPWNYITKFCNGVVIHKNGILHRTFAYRAPDIDSSGAFEINQISVRVNDFAKRLGTGWAFFLEAQRFQLTEYPRAYFDILCPYLIDRERDFSFNSAGKHFDSSYYLTFVYKPPIESVKKFQTMFLNSSQNDNQEMTIKQNIDYFVNESNSIASLLSSNLNLYPLNNEETLQYLHSSISLNRNWLSFPHTQIMLDRILPDMLLENSMPLKLGDYYIPIVGLCDFPQFTYPSILDALNRALLEYRWVTRYICLDKEESKKEVTKKEKSHRGNQKSFLQTFAETSSNESSGKITNHGASIKEQDSIQASIEIDEDIANAGHLTTCIMVWDKSLNKAKKKAELVKTIINSRGFNCKEETFNALEAFCSMMPGNVYANFRKHLVMTNTMSHIIPLSSVWSGIRIAEHAEKITGINIPHLICSTVEGTPFYMSLNVGDVMHTSLFGPTGAGKSTVLNLMCVQFLKYPGSQIISFDKGRSCRQPCLACGGYFYEPASENSSGINFQPLRDLDSDTDILYACDFIEACIVANGEQVNSSMSTAIKETLDQMVDIPKNDRTITTFLQYCQYKDKEGKPILNELLSVYAIGGKYGRIFDNDSSEISMNSRWVAFEMESLMNRGENCVVPALVYLFNEVEKKFDGRFTMLILDEAWLFLKNPIFSDKIAEWLKVLRKKNVGVVFATQDVADVDNSALKTTIMQQCLTKIYLADPTALTPGMKKVYENFGLTETEISLIASAEMKRDYFYTSTIGRRLFQLSLGKLTLAIIGSPDHALLDNLTAQYEHGSFLCEKILNAKGFKIPNILNSWENQLRFKNYYLDIPDDPAPILRNKPYVNNTEYTEENNSQNIYSENNNNFIPQIINKTSTTTSSASSELFEAIETLPARKQNDGSGRAATSIAQKYGISLSSIYNARSVLKSGSPELIESMKEGKISIKTAYKRLKQELLYKKNETNPEKMLAEIA